MTNGSPGTFVREAVALLESAVAPAVTDSAARADLATATWCLRDLASWADQERAALQREAVALRALVTALAAVLPPEAGGGQAGSVPVAPGGAPIPALVRERDALAAILARFATYCESHRGESPAVDEARARVVAHLRSALPSMQ